MNLTVSSQEVNIVFVRPNQGSCKQRLISNGQVCYLGPLPLGASTTIEFRAQSIPGDQRSTDEKPSWFIGGTAKENADDLLLPTNYFSFHLPVK